MRKIIEKCRQFTHDIKLYFIQKSSRRMVKYLKNHGCKIDDSTRLNCDLETFGSEPYLIEVGAKSLIAQDVRLITHDGGISVLNNLDKYSGKKMAKFGKITIGKNTFIGMGAYIMPNTAIGDNCIIGARAVVTKNVPDNSVAVGNPARIICNIENYYKKTLNNKGILNITGLSEKEVQERINTSILQQ